MDSEPLQARREWAFKRLDYVGVCAKKSFSGFCIQRTFLVAFHLGVTNIPSARAPAPCLQAWDAYTDRPMLTQDPEVWKSCEREEVLPVW